MQLDESGQQVITPQIDAALRRTPLTHLHDHALIDGDPSRREDLVWEDKLGILDDVGRLIHGLDLMRSPDIRVNPVAGQSLTLRQTLVDPVRRALPCRATLLPA